MSYRVYPATGSYEGDIAWLSKQIRAATPKAERQPCFICGQHQLITEQHHVLPVRKMAMALRVRRIYVGGYKFVTVWLCPNHHTYIHQFLDEREIDLAIPDITEYASRYTELLDSKHADVFFKSLEGLSRIDRKPLEVTA